MRLSHAPPQAPVLARPTPARSLRGPLWQRWVQRVLLALWTGIVPALLAALVFRYLVPAAAPGPAGIFAQLAHRFWLPFAIGLFFVFSAMARYWRFRLPGGRYSSQLPAQLVAGENDPERLAEWASAASLYEVLVSPRMLRRIRRKSDDSARIELERQVGDLRAGLVAGDFAQARCAANAAESLVGGELAARRRQEVLGAVGGAVVAALAAVGVRTVVEPYRVLSGSMLPTLEPDDLLLSNRIAYKPLWGAHLASAAKRVPARGDLVLFRSDAVAMHRIGGPELLVKRVIGIPGDQISMRGDVPVINGWMVPFCSAGKYLYIGADGEPVRGTVRVEFLEDRTYLTVQSLWTAFDGTYTVKPGEVFVLGDSRSSSVDSRAWNEGQGGGVPLDAIAGRAQWFLVGRKPNGDADLGNLMRPMAAFRRRSPVGGVDAQQLEAGIAKCIQNRPAATRPPEPARNALGDRAQGDVGKGT